MALYGAQFQPFQLFLQFVFLPFSGPPRKQDLRRRELVLLADGRCQQPPRLPRLLFPGGKAPKIAAPPPPIEARLCLQQTAPAGKGCAFIWTCACVRPALLLVGLEILPVPSLSSNGCCVQWTPLWCGWTIRWLGVGKAVLAGFWLEPPSFATGGDQLVLLG